MERTFRDTLLGCGAVIDGGTDAPIHYGSARAELQAVLHLAAVIDRSRLGRILATGPHFLDLMHRLSTGDVRSLLPSEGRSTVLTSPKGRIVGRVFLHHLGEPGVLGICGAGAASRIMEHLARYTFAEQTGLTDVAESTRLIALTGPRAAEALTTGGFDRPDPYQTIVTRFEGLPLFILGHDGATTDGYSMVVGHDRAAALWKALVLAAARVDGRPAGEQALEAARVLRGIPADGHELTDAHNPLEAGLVDSVSFDKGCYVGQEVVARLRNYDKVARVIFGVRLPDGTDPPPFDTAVFRGEREVGRITTAVVPPGYEHPVALAYLKRKDAEAGVEVTIGTPPHESTGQLVGLPFDA